jgi:hypothetical protein
MALTAANELALRGIIHRMVPTLVVRARVMKLLMISVQHLVKEKVMIHPEMTPTMNLRI